MKRIKATVEIEFLVDDDVTINQLEMDQVDVIHSKGMVSYEIRFGKSEQAGWTVWDEVEAGGTKLIKFEELTTNLTSYKIPKGQE